MATIVVVEDQPDNLKLISALLTLKGHRVVGLHTGEQLVATLLAERPAPALADVKKIEGDHPWKVVALTAHAMPGDRERALGAGFDGYITKPINVRTFTEEIGRYLSSDASPSAG